MDDPDELYRRAKLAQRKAEQAGFVVTASAWALVAESVLQGADVDAIAMLHLAGETTASSSRAPSFDVQTSNVPPLSPEVRP